MSSTDAELSVERVARETLTPHTLWPQSPPPVAALRGAIRPRPGQTSPPSEQLGHGGAGGLRVRLRVGPRLRVQV